MKTHIINILHKIEIDYNIKILYACESGSRTWGISSEESDYDVRFIYIHQTNWYLSIDKKRDVLEIPKHDRVSIPVHSLVDMSGWELTKALRLFRKSNPGLLEWLHSNIIYIQEPTFLEKMHQLESVIFSPIPCIYHYVKMAKGNFKSVQEKGPEIKTYINVIRPLFMAKYIEKNYRFGNLNINELVEELLPNDDIKTMISQIIQLKSTGQKTGQQPIELENFIQREIEQIEKYASTLETQIPNPTSQLDLFFRETLANSWN